MVMISDFYKCDLKVPGSSPGVGFFTFSVTAVDLDHRKGPGSGGMRGS